VRFRPLVAGAFPKTIPLLRNDRAASRLAHVLGKTDNYELTPECTSADACLIFLELVSFLRPQLFVLREAQERATDQERSMSSGGSLRAARGPAPLCVCVCVCVYAAIAKDLLDIILSLNRAD